MRLLEMRDNAIKSLAHCWALNGDPSNGDCCSLRQPEGKDKVDVWPSLERWWAEVTLVYVG